LLINDAPLPENEAKLFNPLQLAYIGDCYWEMKIRTTLILEHKNLHHMHVECVRFVNASAQAAFLRQLIPFLNELEMDLIHRGRNAHSRHPAPHHQSSAVYSEATAFETLLGYLYLTGNHDRLNELCNYILKEDDYNG